MTIFVTSDHHFDHANIIGHANRPFRDVDEMNTVLMEKWNTVVGKRDTVYHLGDFAWWRSDAASWWLRRLNGSIHRVRGNHDPKKWGPDYREITVAGEMVVLCHYPFSSWNGSYHGTLHCHGHTHQHDLWSAKNRANVCVEATDYAPIAVEDLLARRHEAGRPGWLPSPQW